jgi:acid phosphatase
MSQERSRGTWVRWATALALAATLGFWTGACAARQSVPGTAPASPAAAPAPIAPAAAPAPAASDTAAPAARAAVPPAEPAQARHELLNAVAWMQTSAEFRAASLAAYGRATVTLDALLADGHATAALEQTGDFGTLPPAVILDVDETVLDNSRFEGEQIRRNATTFDTRLWDQWVLSGQAEGLAGAVEFLKSARKKGIRTFFVTNRDLNGKAATVANLRRVGIEATAADVLVKGENGWSGDKTSRRAHIAATHRILMLCGDDLGDFVSVQGKDVARRAAEVEAHAAWWGERWVILPNPAYGSWERALTGGGDPVTALRKAVRGMTE